MDVSRRGIFGLFGVAAIAEFLPKAESVPLTVATCTTSSVQSVSVISAGSGYAAGPPRSYITLLGSDGGPRYLQVSGPGSGKNGW